MPNTKLLLTSLTLTALVALAGCFPGVYKIDIQQGNVITQDMIDELRPGMSKAQVRYVMGNALITDTFHARRWDYLYSIQPGGKAQSQKRMSLYFNESDQLIALSGDFRLKPGSARDQAILGDEVGSAAESAVQPEESEDSPSLAEAEVVPPQPEAESSSLPEAEAVQPELQVVQARPVVTPQPAHAQTARPGSLEEQLQSELDDVQWVPQPVPDPL